MRLILYMKDSCVVQQAIMSKHSMRLCVRACVCVCAYVYQRSVNGQLQLSSVSERVASVRSHRTLRGHVVCVNGQPHWRVANSARACQGRNLLSVAFVRHILSIVDGDIFWTHTYLSPPFLFLSPLPSSPSPNKPTSHHHHHPHRHPIPIPASILL